MTALVCWAALILRDMVRLPRRCDVRVEPCAGSDARQSPDEPAAATALHPDQWAPDLHRRTWSGGWAPPDLNGGLVGVSAGRLHPGASPQPALGRKRSSAVRTAPQPLFRP